LKKEGGKEGIGHKPLFEQRFKWQKSGRGSNAIEFLISRLQHSASQRKKKLSYKHGDKRFGKRSQGDQKSLLVKIAHNVAQTRFPSVKPLPLKISELLL
jgi:hypothetical protein